MTTGIRTTGYIIIAIFLTYGFPSSAQSVLPEAGWRIRTAYSREWVTDGYVRVREWNVQGDKMQLHDLGMTSYPALKLHLDKTFRNKSLLTISYEYYFIRGSATVNRNIEYNGTIINGSEGIDVAPTRFYRLRAHYHGNLYSVSDFSFRYIAGIVYDHTTFYLDGQVVKGSPRHEVYEQFGKQALPYPEAGLSATYTSNKVNVFTADISGTYIPKFKSFFQEGGYMYLSYSTFLANLDYTRRIGKWEITGGFEFRNTHLFGESDEDTNDLKISVAAPFAGLGFNF